MIERASKGAAAASTALIVVLLLWFHPDITPSLQAAGAAAFLLALIAGGRWGERAVGVCVAAAPLLPALLRLATAREQPVLDVVWMAGLAGALLRAVSWRRWMLPQSWTPLAGGWALVLALAWPVLVGREIAFDPEGLRDVGAVVSWAFWPAPSAAAWILYWALLQLLGLLWLDWMVPRLDAHPDRLPGAAHALWIATTAASVVALIQGTIDVNFLNPPLWAADGRATGTMLEANGYGHCAAIAGPLAFVALRAMRPRAPAWAWTLLAVNWAGVWMSGSRTALLCAAAGAAGLLMAVWQRDVAGSRRRGMAGAALLAAAAAAVVLGATARGPLRRLAEIPLERASVADFWTRGGYGSIAMQIVREYPLTGTGAGTYHFLAPDYYRASADDALPPDNAQNWWRHQAAELGILGGACVLFWSAVLAWHVLAGRRRSAANGLLSADAPARRGEPTIAHESSAQPIPRLAPPIVRGLLIGIGLSSLVGVPTQNPVVLLWFFLLVGWLAALVRVPAPLVTPAGTRTAWIAAAVLAVSYAAGHVLLATGSLSVAARATRFGRPYVEGAHQPESLPGGGGEFRWTDDESRFVLPVHGRYFVVRTWARHPDLAEAPVEVTVRTTCGVLWHDVLRTGDAAGMTAEVPGGLISVDATVTVSRTWKPAEYGLQDPRELGVAVVMDFAGSLDGVAGQGAAVDWPACER